MLVHLLIGLAMLLLCLMLQSVFVTTCLRWYARFRIEHPRGSTRLQDFGLLSVTMMLMMLGNLTQIGMWAALFMLIGEFDSFITAFYHSGVNYAGLGYGDIVMSEDWRLFGPLEAANGVIMFGLSTAVMTAAVIDVIKYSKARLLGSTES